VLWGVACGIVVVACASRSSGDESSTPTRDSKEASFPEEGWAMQGYGHSLYQLRIDAPSAGRSQAPWLLEPRPTTPGDAPATHYATWMRHIQAAPYRQKRVRFSVSARTSGATTRGDVWARAQSATSPADGEGLVGQFNRMPADSEWNEYAVVFDVPEDADGSSTAWAHRPSARSGSSPRG